MKIRFSKMHGLGNDFVVIDGIRQEISLSVQQLRQLADRHFGIGCDQILLVEKPQQADTDFRYRIFNADGQEVEQCGNGARCFVRFVHDARLTEKREIRVETAKGIIVPRLEDGNEVTVDMGIPRFLPAEIPFIPALPVPASTKTEALTHELPVDGKKLEISVVSMGNPHAVLMVDDIDRAPVAHLGPLIETHLSFPQRVNVGFMQIVDRRHIRLRVFERGAGETLACGTGACAAVVTGIRRGLLDTKVNVLTRGGTLSISWDPSQPASRNASPYASTHASVYMTGPAVTVFSGEIDLDCLA